MNYFLQQRVAVIYFKSWKSQWIKWVTVFFLQVSFCARFFAIRPFSTSDCLGYASQTTWSSWKRTLYDPCPHWKPKRNGGILHFSLSARICRAFSSIFSPDKQNQFRSRQRPNLLWNLNCIYTYRFLCRFDVRFVTRFARIGRTDTFRIF